MSQVGPQLALANCQSKKLRIGRGYGKVEVSMLKTVVLFVAHPTLVHAQEATDSQDVQIPERLSPSDLKAITDARIGLVKAALQLTPEQEKYWPAIEEAIRARAEVRRRRVAGLEALSNQQGDLDPSKLLKNRAHALAQKAASLNKLVDAWQPQLRCGREALPAARDIANPWTVAIVRPCRRFAVWCQDNPTREYLREGRWCRGPLMCHANLLEGRSCNDQNPSPRRAPGRNVGAENYRYRTSTP